MGGPLGAVVATGGLIVALVRPATLEGLWLEGGGLAWERELAGEELAPPGTAQGFVLVGAHSGLLACFDAKNGETWRIQTKPIWFAPDAIEVDRAERALVTTSGSLAVVDAAAGKIVREVPLPAAPVSAPAKRASRAFVLLGNGTLACVDLAAGAVAWTADVRTQAAGPPLAPAGGSSVLILGKDGSLLSFANRDGVPSWRLQTGFAQLELAPATDEGRVLVASSNRVAALDAKDGKPLLEETCAPLATPLPFLGRIYTPVRGGDLLEQAPLTGRVFARYPIEGTFAGAATSGRFVVVASGSTVQTFDRGE